MEDDSLGGGGAPPGGAVGFNLCYEFICGASPCGRFGPRRVFASPRPAGGVLTRSEGADASSAVPGVRDAPLEPPYKCFQGGACRRQPRSLGSSRHASMQRVSE